MNTLLSHPDKKLIDHLSEVAKIATQSIKGKSFDFSLDFRNSKIDVKKIVNDLVYFSAAFHDLGKASSFFQKYIRNPDAPHDQRKSHALISALFVYFVAKEYFKNKKINENIARLLSLFSFTAVRKHHGKLDNFGDEILIEKNGGIC